ncbi:hypothetical protein E2C01_017283 [Portunus trituberculatus]|uniref:Uncharacterized protein n=1 Tax=Portunus trituberculatus TaxID=210409 RepID=A0A5B7DSX9_PORTR|nr:hypothetical protein [Portunus trituberculatus]
MCEVVMVVEVVKESQVQQARRECLEREGWTLFLCGHLPLSDALRGNKTRDGWCHDKPLLSILAAQRLILSTYILMKNC